ncbi:helix-turn-helix domain-containing protein [Pseudarthrobacter sp. YS3]|uniref:helix-turn-helix domain-containing protein n=1 Tax=Pseudarthrobacter sp. YS3 TaxID=3453718 RepID=UPI003EED89B8
MAGQKIELGPTGRTVADNVKRVRGYRSLNYVELSRKLAELGRPISPLAVRRIEEGDRRVDVDDLLALAVALGVPPNSLLLPHEDPSPEPTATAVGNAMFLDVWSWADGGRSFTGHDRDQQSWEISRPVRPPGAETATAADLLKSIQEMAANLAAAEATAEAARRGND